MHLINGRLVADFHALREFKASVSDGLDAWLRGTFGVTLTELASHQQADRRVS